MEQSKEKLKVIDIEFKRNNTNKQTLFFDVIEHKFEDQFLVIKHYIEYADKTVRGLQTYIPKENIVQFVVYEEKADYEKYLDDLMDKIPKSSSKDIGIYVHNIAQYALEQYTNPHRIVQHMGKILTTRSLNPNDALLLCSSVTDCIRNITNKEKGCNKAKAKDKASANKVIVMASRGSGKGLIKARSLLKELGIPEEDIKEIFEGLEEEDDE